MHDPHADRLERMRLELVGYDVAELLDQLDLVRLVMAEDVAEANLATWPAPEPAA